MTDEEWADIDRRIEAMNRYQSLRLKVDRATLEGPVGPDIGKMTHAERNEYLFGPLSASVLPVECTCPPEPMDHDPYYQCASCEQRQIDAERGEA